MFSGFFGWLLSMLAAFSIGVNVGRKPVDTDLQQKVQEHIDVIADESAAIVDDVIDGVNDYLSDGETESSTDEEPLEAVEAQTEA